jgi:hypothetical protein
LISFKQFLTERASVSQKAELMLGEETEGGYYIGENNGYYLIVSKLKYETKLTHEDAIQYCLNLNNGYSDWILPSKEELLIAYKNKKTIPFTQRFTRNFHWTCDTDENNYAWLVDMGDGEFYGDNINSSYWVRPFRKIKKV